MRPVKKLFMKNLKNHIPPIATESAHFPSNLFEATVLLLTSTLVKVTVLVVHQYIQPLPIFYFHTLHTVYT